MVNIMKTYIMVLLLTLFFVPVSGQDTNIEDFKPIEFEDHFYSVPDSLARPIIWKMTQEDMPIVNVQPTVSMTSVVLVEGGNAPKRVVVVNFKLARRLSISNGQAWNYSPYPNGHLDARTLRFPMR